MRSSGKRLLGILATLLFLVGSIFVYGYLIRPALDEINELRGKVASRSDVLDNYGAAVKQLQNLLAQYQESADIQNQVSLALPIGQNVPQDINQIVGIAAANNMNVKSLGLQQMAIKPSKAPLVKGMGTLRINTQLAGSYANFKSFLRSLETNITILDMANLKIEIQKDKIGSLFMVYNMSIDTYYQTQ